ncbi:MAG: hypothetical protein SV686_17080 [Thermodesulfobacteriota bacterium]|jgi:hypothetical protein|nr:hypothetical protein [Thermodesulfobacteriota bacterium]
MKIKSKWVIVLISSILGLVLLVTACVYSYFHLGFPPQKNGITRLNLITNIKLSDRDVYYGTTGGFDDWQEYFKFEATENEVERIIISLKLDKKIVYIPAPDFYWWSLENRSNKIYFKDLGSSHYYLHYNDANGEAHFADVHF